MINTKHVINWGNYMYFAKDFIQKKIHMKKNEKGLKKIHSPFVK
jgi:hypothetical protein